MTRQSRTNRRGIRLRLTLTALVVALGVGASPGLALADAPHAKEVPLGTDEGPRSSWELDVGLESLGKSVHKNLKCSQCHAKAEARAANAGIATWEGLSAEAGMCRGCHKSADAAYDQSAHGLALREGKVGTARCQDCHGAHDVYPKASRESRLSKRNVVATCAKCHLHPMYEEALTPARLKSVGSYAESIHGKSLMETGQVKSPSCVDCHGGHVAAIQDKTSTAHVARATAMCAGCHAGVLDDYKKSAHGIAAAKGEKDAPGCHNCHTAHGVAAPGASFKLTSDRQCGTCHQKAFAQHLQTYHGRAHALGGVQVAACYDCHGNHGVLGKAEAGSTVAAANKLGTCRSCHVGAPANYAAYLPHGDPTDRANYPRLYWTYKPMTWLIGGAFALFALHTVVLGLRHVVELLRDRRSYLDARRRRGLVERRTWPSLEAERWSPLTRFIDRFSYGLLLLSFAVQVVAGMPLGFPQAPWARAVFGLLGGADSARSLHRFGAMLTVFCVALHLGSMIAAAWSARGRCRDEDGRFRVSLLLRLAFGPESPLLGPRDARTIWAHVKWIVGRGPEPRFDRYRYWEKLDYLATFIGVAVIGASGLVLFRPAQALRFLPGWIVNVAQVIHREQAWLILVFMLTSHVVHVLLRRTPALLGALYPRPRALATDRWQVEQSS